MALTRFGLGITTMAGKFSGTYFKRGRHGNHCQPLPRTTQQRSTAQNTQRNLFRKLVAFWHSASMTPAHRQAWSDSAHRHPVQNLLGERCVLTGYQNFIRYNLPRVHMGLDPDPNPPE